MSTPDEEAPRVPFDVRAGLPTDDELAALIAVVTEGYASEAAGAVAEETTRSAWSISQRALRAPLRRELGWGRFGG